MNVSYLGFAGGKPYLIHVVFMQSQKCMSRIIRMNQNELIKSAKIIFNFGFIDTLS